MCRDNKLRIVLIALLFVLFSLPARGAVRTALGTAGIKSPANSSSNTMLSSVTLSTGDVLIVGVAMETGASDSINHSITWNAITMSKLIENHSTVAAQAAIWYLVITSGATGNIIYVAGSLAAGATEIWASKWTGLTSTPNDQSVGTGAASGTAVDSGSTGTTAQADEIVISCLSLNGPDGDTNGTFGTDTNNTGQYAGTTGSGATSNVNAAEGYGTQTSTGTRKSTMTGQTARAWAIVVGTFKIDTSFVPGNKRLTTVGAGL